MTKARPSDRYGSTREPGRRPKWLLWALFAFVAIAGVGVAVAAYNKFAVHEIDSTAISFDLVDESTLSIRFTVTRDDPSDAAVCIVRARSKDGSETGRREVLVPPAQDGTIELTAPIRTSRPPAMGDIYGCSLDVPEYLTGN